MLVFGMISRGTKVNRCKRQVSHACPCGFAKAKLRNTGKRGLRFPGSQLAPLTYPQHFSLGVSELLAGRGMLRGPETQCAWKAAEN